jgi:eukaryotic-like serine/threonine-protein kinase
MTKRSRLQDIREGRIAIESSAAPVRPAATQRKSRERIAWAVAAASIIAALALSDVLLLQKPKPGLPVQATLLPPKDHIFSGGFAISPDGKKIAFVASDPSTRTSMLWIRSLDSTAAQPLAGTEGSSTPFWSPDSRFVAFFAAGDLKKVDAGGGPVVTLAPIGHVNPQGGTWGKDGTIIFTRGTTGEGLYQVSSDGGPATLVTRFNRGEFNHRWPFFLPDGRHVMFQVLLGDPSQQEGLVEEIHVLDRVTKEQNFLLRADSDAQYANGYIFFVQHGNLVAQPFDVPSLKLSGSPVPVAQQVQVFFPATGAFSVSPSGLLAFQSGNLANTQLVWYTRDGKETGQLGSLAGYNTVSLSPDGTRAVTSLGDDQAKRRDIWVFDVARGTATRATLDGAGANYPVWGNEGTRIFFLDAVRGVGIYTNSTNGLRQSELVEPVRAMAVPNGISPDGKFLVYMNFEGQPGPRLWIHPFAPAKPEAKDYPLLGTKFNEAHAQFSSDGHWLTYDSDETGKEEVYAVPFPNVSNKVQISASGGSQPRWRRDGKEIYYISPDGKMMAAAVEVSGNSLKPVTLTALFQTRIVTVTRGYHQYGVTADGQRFLINSNVEQSPEPITLYANWTAGLKK